MLVCSAGPAFIHLTVESKRWFRPIQYLFYYLACDLMTSYEIYVCATKHLTIFTQPLKWMEKIKHHGYEVITPIRICKV